MSKVTSLSMYRQAKAQQITAMLQETRDAGMSLDMDDVVGRDYTQMGDVIHGILRLKNILSGHLGPLGEWPGMLLDILGVVDAGVRTGTLDNDALAKACQELAVYIDDRLNMANQLGLGAALVLLSFIENAPRMTGQLRN